MQDGPPNTADQNWEDGGTAGIPGAQAAEGYVSAKTLQLMVLSALMSLALLMLMFGWTINERLSIQPRDVLRAIDERLEVTPKQVMERLDRIEKEHMNYVNEYRKLHEGK